MMTHVQALRDQADWYRRQMSISGPRDRAELQRLAQREEDLAARLECDAPPVRLFEPAPAVIPGQASLSV